MNAAVAFFVFNRPTTTRRVFEAIAAARPRILMIVADGPRKDRSSDEQSCVEARAIAEHVDWPCDVRLLYADHNLGCRRRMSSGLDWVFRQVDEAIILEDDCLPSAEFFSYCDTLLNHYRYDQRVMHIAGSSSQLGNARTESSYYFSKYTHIWGWATWRRAWQFYDVNMASWPNLRAAPAIKDWFDSDLEEIYWTRLFDELYSGADTWDGQWTYACLRQNGLAAVPACNLVSNIGFGPDATHTHGSSPFADLPLGRLGAINHPDSMIRHKVADQFSFEEHFGGRQLREAREFHRRARMAFGRLRRSMLRRIWKREARK